MSTPAVTYAFRARMSQKGSSDLAQIRIDVRELKSASSSSRTSAIILTYDSFEDTYETSGRYSYVKAEQATTTGVPQTAVLLAATAPLEDEVVLNFQKPVPAGVRWRAAGIVMDALPPRGSATSIISRNGPIQLPDASLDPENEHFMYTAFFAGSSVDVPLMSNTGIKLSATAVDEMPPIPGTAGRNMHWVEVFRWNQKGAVADRLGPWFYAELPLIWNRGTPPPPSIISDNFWAPPAPCDNADVMIINNNDLAPNWDVPDTPLFPNTVLDQPDTLVLNTTDEDGTRWMVNDIDGWWTLPPPDLPDLARPGYQDGSFPVDGRYEPRIITLKGTFWPASNTSVAVPRLRLLRTLDAVRGGAIMVVKEPEWPKQALVWLADQPRVETQDLSGKTEFEVQLKAVDPIKYHSGLYSLQRVMLPYAGAIDGRNYNPLDLDTGQRFKPVPNRTFSVDLDAVETAQVVNIGTATVWPRFYIYGPATNIAIVNTSTGMRMIFQGTIAKNEMLVVDCYWRVIVMDNSSIAPIGDPYNQIPSDTYSSIPGENRRWMLRLSSPWMYFKPGINNLYFTCSGGSFPPIDPPDVPSDEFIQYTECWTTFRSGWVGS